MNSNHNINVDNQKVDEVFQVSINSKKLMSILAKIQLKIQNTNDFCREGDNQLNKKIFNLESNMKSIVKFQIEQSKNLIQMDFRKSQEKYIKELLQKQSKINELKYSLQTLNDKINKVNSSLTEKIQQSVRNYSTENFALKRNFQKSQQTYESVFEQVFQKLQTFKNDIKDSKDNIFDLQVKLKRYTEIALRPQQWDRIAMPDKKFEDCINPGKYAVLLQQDNSSVQKQKTQHRIVPKQKSKSKKPIKKSFFSKTSPIKKSRIFKPQQFEQTQPTQNYMSTLQYASISAKVQNLQKVLQQKNQTQSIEGEKSGLFKRETKTSMIKTFSYQKEESDKILKKQLDEEYFKNKEIQDNENMSKIYQKLEILEKSVETKDKNLQKSIEELKQKSIIGSEKIDFIKQKINKINSEIAELKIRFISIENKAGQTFDTISISNMQNQIGKIIQRLDKESQTKLQIEEYQKQKVKLEQKVNIFQVNLIEKAEKADVKKAINFLEDKIKEIILLMANQFNMQKMGAINKQPAKCLTCDKEVLKLDTFTNSGIIKGLTPSKSSREIGQKYYTRLLKSKRQNRPSTKKLYQNYTTFTQLSDLEQ